jgi:hypothetical protein
MSEPTAVRDTTHAHQADPAPLATPATPTPAPEKALP